MKYISIAERLLAKEEPQKGGPTPLPLLLAGPIVRRTEPTQVSIWFVLKKNIKATLQIYETNSVIEVEPYMSGTLNLGIAIGEHVFVYCITARGKTMSPGNNYYYDIDFGKEGTLSSFIDGGLDLAYDGSLRPSFTLPPTELDDVRLIHGSCRKPHGEGYDAMEGVHEMLLTAVEGSTISAEHRPHQLFLTGDQIYADDVADALLFMIDDAAKALFKWNEDYAPFTEDDLLPSKRNSANKLRNYVGFTGMLPNKPGYSKSHLLKFREYATMYLFVWSDVLWPADPLDNSLWPKSEIVGKKDRTNFKNESEHLKRFMSTLGKVRKALANIPTYMIFDDHEITDDWNINWHWCKEVYSKKLGRRTVQNGLLAYSLFQAWGNTPDQFDRPDKRPLLAAAKAWRGAEDGNFTTIKRLLNIPTIDSNADVSEFPHPNYTHIDWHFSYQLKKYSVYVMDSRTWRSYPTNEGNDYGFVDLISQKGWDKQFPREFTANDVILVVSPAPVIGEPFSEWFQSTRLKLEGRYDRDTEAWALNQFGFEKLIGNLASRLPATAPDISDRKGRIAFLSGDVHSGLSARCQIWGDQFINDQRPGIKTDAIFTQLTASSFKNQTYSYVGTVKLHKDGYPLTLTVKGFPKPLLKLAWFNKSQSLGKYKDGLGNIRDYFPESTIDGLTIKTPVMLEKEKVQRFTLLPDWRYRVDWILGASTGKYPNGIIGPARIDVPPSPNDRAKVLQDYLKMTNDHHAYTKEWGAGKEIVGLNNLGEIRFNFAGDKKAISHILWWRMDPRRGDAPLQLFPLTTYTIPMNYIGDKNKDNAILGPTALVRPTYKNQ